MNYQLKELILLEMKWLHSWLTVNRFLKWLVSLYSYTITECNCSRSVRNPAIVKSVKNQNNLEDKLLKGTKQTIKSAINISSILSSIGLIGALGAHMFGPVGSLVGMESGLL
jgi:hypothetical protein